MRGTSAQAIGIVAIVFGLFIGVNSELSFNAWLIGENEYERCSSMEAPARAIQRPENMVFEARSTKFPLGLSCSWKLDDGDIATQAFPLWAWTTYEFAGWAMAGAGAFILIRQRWLSSRYPTVS